MTDAIPAARLERTLKSRHVAMISIGGIIGAGLFVGSSAAIASVGPAISISYVLAGILILLSMRMIAELATSHPHKGAFTEFTRDTLGNWAGFTAGWLYWYFWVVVIAIEAIAGAVILREWLPLEVWQIGLILMVVMTVVNLMSTRSYGEFEFWFASLKVAAIIAFLAIGIGHLVGTPPAGGTFVNLYAHQGFAPFGFAAALSGVVTVIFSLTGAEIATLAAAESESGTKTIGSLTTSVAIRITLFYFAAILVIVMIVPWTEVKPGTSPFATALDRVGLAGAATIMNAIVLIAVLSCLNSGMYVASRMLFTLASQGDAPQGLVKLDRRKVPARAILLGTIFGYAGVIASVVSPEVVFAFLVNACGATMIIIYLMVAIAQIRSRRRLEKENPEKLVIKMWLFPGLSYLAVAGMVAVLAAMTLTRDLRIQLLTSVAALAVVLGLYVLVRRRGVAVKADLPTRANPA